MQHLPILIKQKTTKIVELIILLLLLFLPVRYILYYINVNNELDKHIKESGRIDQLNIDEKINMEKQGFFYYEITNYVPDEFSEIEKLLNDKFNRIVCFKLEQDTQIEYGNTKLLAHLQTKINYGDVMCYAFLTTSEFEIIKDGNINKMLNQRKTFA